MILFHRQFVTLLNREGNAVKNGSGTRFFGKIRVILKAS